MMKVLAVTVSAVSAFIINQPAGDPTCKNGVRSIVTDPTAVTVCCPKYCGRCNDYETCKNVNGQNSENACCASKVQSLTCENNAEDPYCIKSCKGKSAPCSLGVAKDFEAPPETSASADCGKAAGDYTSQATATVEGVVGADSEHAKTFKQNVADGNISK